MLVRKVSALLFLFEISDCILARSQMKEMRQTHRTILHSAPMVRHVCPSLDGTKRRYQLARPSDRCIPAYRDASGNAGAPGVGACFRLSSENIDSRSFP